MRTVARIVPIALLVVACGAESTPEPVEESSGAATPTTEGPTSTAPPTSAATTTTTTTTLPPDPGEVLRSELASRGIGESIQPDQLISTAELICEAVAADADPEQGFYAEGAGRFFVAGEPAAGEVVAVMIETVCPDNAALLELSSDEWARARTADFEVGDCYYEAALFARVPVDCSEPHSGEVAGFVDAQGLDFPTPETRFEFFNQIDCRSPVVDYLGGEPIGLGYGTTLLAGTAEEWEAGQTEVMCTGGTRSPILQGSLQGAGSRIQAVAEAVDFTISTCTNETFEATISNGSDSDVAVHVSFSGYYPTGAEFSITEPSIAAGETVTVSRTFEEPDPDAPVDCERSFVAAFPVPLGG